MMMASILTLRPAIPSLDREIKARPSKKEIKLEADLEKVDEFAGLMRKEIRNILLDYADKVRIHWTRSIIVEADGTFIG